MVGGARDRAGTYDVSIYGSSSGIELVPSSSVRNSKYQPSKEVEELTADMWKYRRPRVIGSVSESMATEILSNARIVVDDCSWAIVCEKLRNVRGISGLWKPNRGIYCDDLIAIAESHGQKLMFLTEVKGTTLKAGLSHSMEAKIFYQLARTCVTLKRLMPSGPCQRIRGVITVAIIHSWRKITINVLSEATARGYFPDGWLPPTENY
jgi:hypothetical protein